MGGGTECDGWGLGSVALTSLQCFWFRKSTRAKWGLLCPSQSALRAPLVLLCPGDRAAHPIQDSSLKLGANRLYWAGRKRLKDGFPESPLCGLTPTFQGLSSPANTEQ